MNPRERMASRAGLILGTAFVVAITSCAGHGATTGSPHSTTGPETTASDSPQQQSNLVIDVTIAGGVVSPVNAELTAVVGEPIMLVVNSDAADEIHVHSIPDRAFDVAAQQNQRFEFTVTVPGRVEVELHRSERTIAIIQVRP